MIRATRKRESESNFETELASGLHTFGADAGPESGGAGKEPSPHALLEGALAACTSITVEMYAKRKGWPLDSANVEVSILSEGRKTFIARKVIFQGPLDDEMRHRLLEIAERCPIHRILVGEVEIATTGG